MAMNPHKLSTLFILCAFAVLPFRRAIDVPPSSRNGTTSSSTSGLTPLQQHASFFDRNKDGIIYPQESYEGMRALGLGVGAATMSALFINGILSPKTVPKGKIPSPLLPVYVENISRGKHGGDTDVYDYVGRFVPEKFEEIFTKYARTNPNALTSQELDNMLQVNKDPNDSNGNFGALGEWKLLYELGNDKDGFLQKDTIRSVYDGSLFYKLEKQTSSSQN